LPDSARPKQLLNERRLRRVEIGAANVGPAGEHANILAERFFLDHGTQAFCNFISHGLERQLRPQNMPVDGHQMEPKARFDHLGQQASRPQPEQHPFKLGNRIAAADLPEVAALLTGGAVGQLRRYGGEAFRFTQQLVQSLFCPGAHFGNAH